MAQSNNTGTHNVQVYIYDMSKGMAQALSLPLLGKQINGVWHTGVVAFGMEYFFGSDGISYCEPVCTGFKLISPLVRFLVIPNTQAPTKSGTFNYQESTLPEGEIIRALPPRLTQQQHWNSIEAFKFDTIPILGDEAWIITPSGKSVLIIRKGCKASHTILGQPDEIKDLGNTHISYDIFMDYLYEQSNDRFRPEKYSLFDHNCNTFSNEVAQFLTGKKIPSHILDLPAEVANTPLGSMMKTMTNNIAVNPSGGSKLFDRRSAPSSSSSKQSSHNTKSSTSKNNSATHSQSSAESSFSPVVYSGQKPNQADGSVLFNVLSTEEKVLVEDVYEYLSNESPNYSLGKNHLKTLVQLVLNNKVNDPQVKSTACSLLQALVLREDALQVLKHDRDHHMAHLLLEFDNLSHDNSLIIDILKMITNCCSSNVGLNYLTSSEENTPPLSGFPSGNNGPFSYMSLTRDAVVNGLLLRQRDVNDVAAAAAFNMHKMPMNDDLLIAFSSALTQCLQREEILEDTAFLGLQCLQWFIKGNSEICALVKMMELNYQRLSQKSTRVKNTCDRICDIFAEEIDNI